MADLTAVLADLPAEGVRLRGGLALRLTSGNGMTVLGCSRINMPPGDIELSTVIGAVKIVFQPSHLFRERTVQVIEKAGNSHHIIRIYWPDETLEFLEAPSYQGGLL